ncbi:SusC/RagA family TonB-linked outer membrane protein [Pedobacter sp. HMF7056]|uniref:SusC/RagA family TonB-linked outer membrane protein n=2 Tax=Hufsiella ginkgonis TaxID=2695274 RepID=A0A7K1Y1W5_9SPHI|nr:SusC/RagA family TonB-linked outer membrane protein [Hufsiella ginkgonis]
MVSIAAFPGRTSGAEPGITTHRLVPVNAPVTVTGKVTDNKGEALPGVTVLEKGTTNTTATTGNGSFKITVAGEDAVLVFSFVGFDTKEVSVKRQTTVDVRLTSSSTDLTEVVVVGYGQQKKVTVTGSVASVTGAEIVTTKTQNLQNTLTGKVPGLRVIQRTSEPGTFDNRFDIRGFGNALIVVDGVPRGNIERIDPNDVESISVLKDAAAAVYGVRAANGVVLITTKKGTQGKARIEYSYLAGFQNPSGLPRPLNAVDRAVIFNEQSMHSLTNPVITVPDDLIKPYIDGTRDDIDWYDRVMRDNAPQSQQNLGVSGGSDKVDYFVNLGYAYQGGFWRTNDLNYKKYNFRTNLNAAISDRLKASLRISGVVDQQDRPFRDSWEIFKNLWRSRPDDYYYANDNPQYIYRNQADYHPGAISSSDYSGYHIINNKIFQSSFSLDYMVPRVEGLTARGVFSYDVSIADRTDYQKTFAEYEYNAITNAYTPVNYQVPNQVTRNFGNNPSQLVQLSLNYKHAFAKHSVDALALVEQSSSSGDGFFAQRQLSISLPYLFAGNAANQVGNASTGSVYQFVNKGLVGRIDYNYASKYLLNLSFRYDGSSKFPSSKQWGFFPSVQGGWRISEEGFFKRTEALSFVSNLKARASYGVLGDDGASSFQFITGYDYPFSGGNSQALGSGYLFDGWTTALGFRSVANPNITWYTAKMTNLGLDADLWRGKLGITFDAFRRDRSGLLGNRLLSLPLSFGSSLPQENLNSDRTEGFELALTHKNTIGADLGIDIGGNISLTRTLNRYVERAADGSSYARWRNSPTDRYNDVWFGLGYVGQYQSYEQIRNAPVYTGRGTLPGDYIYEDWNNDGTIDDMDRYPIATSTNPTADFNGKRNYPLLNFGLTLGAHFKSFDMNALFQGAARAYASYGEMYQVLTSNALDFFMDRWHPQDPKKDPYDPSNIWVPGKQAYTGTSFDINSARGIQNTSYVRLKTIELGYTLPSKLTKKAGISSLRVYANGYNLFTFSGVLGIDPEHPSDIYGYMYPMNKTVNFGASLRL